MRRQNKILLTLLAVIQIQEITINYIFVAKLLLLCDLIAQTHKKHSAKQDKVTN